MLTLQLSDPVEKIRGVGPRYLKYLHKLGITTVKDLLWHFPFRYEDFSRIKKIKDLQPGETASIIGTITKISLRRSWRKKMFIIEGKVEDDTGSINVIWFNQTYLIKNLPVGTTVSLSGKIKTKGKQLLLSSPVYEIISQQKLNKNFFSELRNTARLVPIYPETKGLSSRAIRYLVQYTLKHLRFPADPLPLSLIQKYHLLPLAIALRQIHFPDSLELAQKAKNRFIWSSLLLSQLYLLKIRTRLLSLKFPRIKLDIPLLKSWVQSLPFTLTPDQKQALWEIAQNLARQPMNRLLEGDVGSGKTIVAIGAALLTYKSNYQVAVMAPTEILAQQHFQKFKQYLQSFSVRLALLTSSGCKYYEEGLEGKISKKAFRKIISSSLPIVVIGTHALIQKDILFNKLGLVIVDEQHRFGVEQRKKLLLNNKQEIPHLLSLTATPIPRTLALVFYGDMDLSVLQTMPQGRKKVITKVVLPRDREKIYQFIRQEIHQGHQAFVICPRIETPEDKSNIKASDLLTYAQKLNYEVKAVKKEYQKLSQEIFPDLRIAMLHGKLKPAEKEEIMKKFKQGEIDILVSTSVVEVGIDVPNATIMMIEGAEHFGLAQLHQFRGRVGRSSFQSYCFLFTENTNSSSIRRLRSLVKYNDGFRLAEIDLSLRGPGEFLGTKQSGIPDLIMKSLLNKEMVQQVHQEAKELLRQSPDLKKWPALATAFQEFVQSRG